MKHTARYHQDDLSGRAGLGGKICGVLGDDGSRAGLADATSKGGQGGPANQERGRKRGNEDFPILEP